MHGEPPLRSYHALLVGAGLFGALTPPLFFLLALVPLLLLLLLLLVAVFVFGFLEPGWPAAPRTTTVSSGVAVGTTGGFSLRMPSRDALVAFLGCVFAGVVLHDGGRSEFSKPPPDPTPERRARIRSDIAGSLIVNGLVLGGTMALVLLLTSLRTPLPIDGILVALLLPSPIVFAGYLKGARSRPLFARPPPAPPRPPPERALDREDFPAVHLALRDRADVASSKVPDGPPPRGAPSDRPATLPRPGAEAAARRIRQAPHNVHNPWPTSPESPRGNRICRRITPRAV